MSYDPAYAVKIVKTAAMLRRYRMLEAVERAPFVIKYGSKRSAMYGFARIDLYIPSRGRSMGGSVMFNPETPRHFIRTDLLKAMVFGLAREMVRPEEVPIAPVKS